MVVREKYTFGFPLLRTFCNLEQQGGYPVEKMDILHYLKPEVVQTFHSIQLIARVIVEGFLVGLHKSPFHGFSAEFSDYRPYMSGDDLRLIDWKVYGRTDRLYIKRFEDETNLTAWLILDKSRSMAFQSGELSKFQYGKYLLAGLAYLLYKQRDNFSLVIFDEKIAEFTPARHSINHLFHVYSRLEKTKPGHKTSLASTMHEIAGKIRNRGMVVLVSDFMGIPLHEIKDAILHFLHGKNELIVFHIVDPQELQFDYSGLVEFVDMETGERVRTRADKIREQLILAQESEQQELRQFCQNHRIDYHRISTRDNFALAMQTFFAKRSVFK